MPECNEILPVLLICLVFIPSPGCSIKCYVGLCHTGLQRGTTDQTVDNIMSGSRFPCRIWPFSGRECRKEDDMCITMTYLRLSPQNVPIGAIRQDMCGNSVTDCKKYKKVPDTIGECIDKPVPPVEMVNIVNGKRDTAIYKQYRGCSCGDKDFCNASWMNETFPQLTAQNYMDPLKYPEYDRFHSNPPANDYDKINSLASTNKDMTFLSLTYGLMANLSAALKASRFFP